MNIRTSCLVRLVGRTDLGRVRAVWIGPSRYEDQPVEWISVELADGGTIECEAADVNECTEPKDTAMPDKVPKLHEKVVSYLDQIDEGEA